MAVSSRGARAPSIPLANTAEFRAGARRTAFVRVGLAAALIAVLLLDLAVARRAQQRESAFFPGGASGVVVLDLSTSIDLVVYARVERALRHIIATGQPVGLVAFSDTAYELLPPGTSPAELRPLLRFFGLPGQQPFSAAAPVRPVRLPESPWSEVFRGGTRISSGLRLAREMLERERIERGSVLLISDLDDSAFDTPYLTRTLIGYARDSVTLRVVPLFPSDEDRDLFRRHLGEKAFVTPARLTGQSRPETASSLVAGSPRWLVALGGLLVLLLALNERLCGRLTWRTRRSP